MQSGSSPWKLIVFFAGEFLAYDSLPGNTRRISKSQKKKSSTKYNLEVIICNVGVNRTFQKETCNTQAKYLVSRYKLL
jgi:hypothetical protein